MAIQNLSGIESMLQQMRAAVRAASGDTNVSGTMAAREANGGFAAELQRSLRRVSDAQQSSYAQAEAFELGVPGVSLNDVMINMQKASISFQTAVQVRNRLVAAYQEIASMQV